jgi:type I restriction enzyme R subunit
VKPEEEAREKIDEILIKAGWTTQEYKELNLSQSLGVTVGIFPLKTQFADYLLLVDRRAVGVIEAKPEGTTLSGVSEQTEKILLGVPENIPHAKDPLPFAHESTSTETPC